jgi:hypothetical protein
MMPTSKAAIRAISLSSVQGQLRRDASKLRPAPRRRHVQRDAPRTRAQRRRDDRQVMRVERNADPADDHRVASTARGGRSR